MISMRGKTKRANRRDEIWHRHLDWIVKWYWSLSTRSPADAKAHLDVLQDRLNRFCYYINPDSTPVIPVSQTSIINRIHETTKSETWRSKYGAKAAREKFPGSYPSRKPDKFLDVVQIDHSWADQHASEKLPRTADGKEIFVVDFDSMIVIGRPWISIAWDVKTEIVLAHTIFFRDPSIHTMCDLLRSAIMSNEWLKEKYGFLTEVPVGHGRPSTLILDNAWAHTGVSMKTNCADFGIEIEWCAVGCPTGKPEVERAFSTIKKGFFHKAPGGVPLPAEQMQRLGLDPRKDAAMSIEQIEAALVHFLYKDWPRRYSSQLKMSPLQAWRNQAAIHSIPIVDDMAFLDLALGKFCRNLTLDRHGVIYEGLRFHDPLITSSLLEDLIPLSKKSHQRRSGSWTVKVTGKINPATISRISIYNEARGYYVELPNVDRKFPRGLDLETYLELRKFARENDRQFATDEQRSAVRDEGRRMLEAGSPARRSMARKKQFRLRNVLAADASSERTMVVAHPMSKAHANTDNTSETPVELGRNRADLTQIRKDPIRGQTKRKKKARQNVSNIRVSEKQSSTVQNYNENKVADDMDHRFELWPSYSINAQKPSPSVISPNGKKRSVKDVDDRSCSTSEIRSPMDRSNASYNSRSGQNKHSLNNEGQLTPEDPAAFLKSLGTGFGF